MTKHVNIAALYPGAEVVKLGDQTVFVVKQQPTQGDVHVNAPLTNVAIAFMQTNDRFVADRVFPNVPVSKQSDLYRIYDRSFFYRSEMEIRAPGTRSKSVGYEMSTTSYYCPVWALNHPIPDQVRSNADADVQLDRNGTRLLSQQALLRREISFITNFFTTSIWTSGRTGVASSPVAGTSVLQWNDANSTPVEDIRMAKRTVAQLTGMEPNKLTVGREVMDVLIDHPDIVDRVKYAGGVNNANPAKVTRDAVTALFELDEILVMNAVRNTAKEGQTASYSFIGGKHAMLTHTPAAPSPDVPSAGYTFGWTGYLGAGENGARVSRYRDDPIRSDVIELELAFDQKVTSADLGFFFSGVIA
jgi:hypothetical protein